MKTRILKEAKALKRNEMKAVSGSGTRTCCEWIEGPKGQSICIFWITPGQVCP